MGITKWTIAVGWAFSLTFDGLSVERRTLEGLSGCKPDLHTRSAWRLEQVGLSSGSRHLVRCRHAFLESIQE